MGYQNNFKRYELKYLISKSCQKAIINAMQSHVCDDAYGRSTIMNIYYDTPDKLLIRRSIDRPCYKEKLRARSYGTAKTDGKVFLEIKKKYNGVVTKRRTDVGLQFLDDFIAHNVKFEHPTQIERELEYFTDHYEVLEPSVFLSYERQAFYDIDDHDFRITFDENILWRDTDIDLTKGAYGTPILEKGYVLMELKVATAIPLWAVEILSKNEVYKTSFSKYGSAYTAMIHHAGEVARHYA